MLAHAIGTEYVTLNIHTNGTQMEEFNQRSGSEANTVLRFVVAANDSCWFLYVVGLFQNVTGHNVCGHCSVCRVGGNNN